MQHARAMNALDAIQLDVRRGRRARHERERATRPHRVLERPDGLRHEPHHLILTHDADVKVRHERERAPPLCCTAVEHEGAGLRDGDGAAREGAVELVELLH